MTNFQIDFLCYISSHVFCGCRKFERMPGSKKLMVSSHDFFVCSLMERKHGIFLKLSGSIINFAKYEVEMD